MNAQELVARVRNLPAVSQTALQLANLLGQSAISNDNVVELLKCDSVLTAKVLRACNSSYFGLDEPVYSVDQAVLMLGHQQTLHIVLTLAFGGAMVVPLAGYAEESNALWHHSLTAAKAAEIIAREEAGVETDVTVAFTVGLLHDIGKLVISQAVPAEVHLALRENIACCKTRTEAERSVLGTDHAEVGAVLLRAWRLPREIVEAVGNHHHPVLQPQPQLSAVAYLANLMAHAVEPARNGEIPSLQVEAAVSAALDLSAERLAELVVSARDQLAHVEEFMKLA